MLVVVVLFFKNFLPTCQGLEKQAISKLTYNFQKQFRHLGTPLSPTERYWELTFQSGTWVSPLLRHSDCSS